MITSKNYDALYLKSLGNGSHGLAHPYYLFLPNK